MTKKGSWNAALGMAACICIGLFWSNLLYAIENSECMDCHGDKALSRERSEGMQETVYVDLNKFKLSVHNINGVRCVDCHADIQELDYDQDLPHSATLAMVNCSGCHEVEGEAYLNSVHRKAGAKGITIPCHACHGYHYVTYLEPASVFERQNRFCLKCHDPHKFHDWLPQKDTHFSYVECTVCHAPDAARDIHLRVFDLVRGKFLSSGEILEALNIEAGEFMSLLDVDKNGIISVAEFENYVFLLRQRGIRGTFHGELLSDIEPVIHHVNRGEAKRECEMCHVPTSPFFQSVHLILENNEGGLDHFPVERRVLETYYLSHFYAIGGTRVRVLDKIGIALLAGGLLVVISHLTARIATISIRRARKEEEKEQSRKPEKKRW